MIKTIIAPPAKSLVQRAFAASLLSEEEPKIKFAGHCNDSLMAYLVTEAVLSGQQEIRCGESGLCARMFAPILGLYPRSFYLTGIGTLLKRPLFLKEPLKALGMQCVGNDYLPLQISGPITNNDITIDCSKTSQVLTGILMALPKCSKNSRVKVLDLKSKPYVDLTLDLLQSFGVSIEHDSYKTFYIKGNQRYSTKEYTVEGDWSGAAFILIWGAINGVVCVDGLNLQSKQADRAILDVLNMVGAEVSTSSSAVMVKKANLKSFEFSVEDCPDLLPSLVTLASFCEGKSRIFNTQRIQFKESDRASALFAEFSKLGARIKIDEDSVEVIGSKLTFDRVDSHEDHRIAMALMIAGAEVLNPECIKKSYPGFFKDLAYLELN